MPNGARTTLDHTTAVPSQHPHPRTDSTMELATYIFTALAVIMAAHAVLYAMCAAWNNKRSYVVRHGEGATLLERLDDGLAKEAAMRADPPWYIQYANWLERKVFSRAKDDRLYTPTSGYHGDPEEGT